MFLISGDAEDTSGGQMGLQAGWIDVSGEMVGTIDFTLDGTVGVLTFFVKAVDNQGVVDDFHLKNDDYYFIFFII